MARKKAVDADSAVAAPHEEDVLKVAEEAPVDPTPEDTSELRDKIAIEVLSGYIANMGCDPEAVGPLGNRTTERNKDVLAKASYAYADAMLAERSK